MRVKNDMPRLPPCSAQPPEPGARPGPGFSAKVSPGVGSSWPELCLISFSTLHHSAGWAGLWAWSECPAAVGSVTAWLWPPASGSRRQHLEKIGGFLPPFRSDYAGNGLHWRLGGTDVPNTCCPGVPPFLTPVLLFLENEGKS